MLVRDPEARAAARMTGSKVMPTHPWVGWVGVLLLWGQQLYILAVKYLFCSMGPDRKHLARLNRSCHVP